MKNTQNKDAVRKTRRKVSKRRKTCVFVGIFGYEIDAEPASG